MHEISDLLRLSPIIKNIVPGVNLHVISMQFSISDPENKTKAT